MKIYKFNIYKVDNNIVNYSDEFIFGLASIGNGLISILSLGRLKTDIYSYYIKKNTKKLLNKLSRSQ